MPEQAPKQSASQNNPQSQRYFVQLIHCSFKVIFCNKFFELVGRCILTRSSEAIRDAVHYLAGFGIIVCQR